MADIVVFVHGTGVRGQEWASSFTLVKQRLLGLMPMVRVYGCFWGGSEGAELKADGASIPEYDETGGSDPSPDEENLALWAVLYTDPWYEIRLLGDWLADDMELAPGEEPPSARFIRQVENFQPSQELGQLLAHDDLRPHFDAARDTLLVSPEFGRAAGTATMATLNEHRKAVARALVAFTIVHAADSGAPPVDGAARDTIVTAVTDDLHGFGLGVAGWLTRPFQGIAAGMVTQRLSRRRGALSDATSPAAGDIIRYQSRGAGIRRYIRQVVVDSSAGDPGASVTLIGHSLGGIACVETLIEEPVPGVDRLVTVGSQAPFFYEIDALASLPFGEPLPDHFPPWLNIYDGRDFLSYVGSAVFPGRVTDRAVNNAQPFPQAHGAYWRNDAVWLQIAGFLA
jgi:pimeloyl-ACP methyl ester carboxylesterase